MDSNHLSNLSLSGKIPVQKDSLIRTAKEGAIADLSIFNKVNEILKGPTDLPVCIWDMILVTSASSVGETKKEEIFPTPI